MKPLPKKLQEKRDKITRLMDDASPYDRAERRKTYRNGYNACWADVSEAVIWMVDALECYEDITDTGTPNAAMQALEIYRKTIGSESDEE